MGSFALKIYRNAAVGAYDNMLSDTVRMFHWRYWFGRHLPFVEPDQVFHYGNPFVVNGAAEPWPEGMGVSWLFEPGLFPISLDSGYWALRSGPGAHFRFAGAKPFRFLLVERTLDKFGAEIEKKAIEQGLLVGGQLTDNAYDKAFLSRGCSPHPILPARQAALEVCLSLLANADDKIDGLWWERVDPRISQVQRGGFLQGRLPLPVKQLQTLPIPPANPMLVWRRSNIF